MPHPASPGFDPDDDVSLAEMTSLIPPRFLESLQFQEIDQDGAFSASSTTAPSQQLQASPYFQADAAHLQSVDCGVANIKPLITGTPPPLPSPAPCEWYLPTPELATSLLAEFLNDFNAAIPLYQPDDLVNHIRTCYAATCEDKVVAWTSAYIVFGMAHALRAMSGTGTIEDNAMAKYYLAKIYTALTPLLFAPPSLGVVQCLLGVAALITHLSCRYNMKESHFVATALRVIQGLTYEPDVAETPSSDYPNTTQHQRRVFWLAFIADTMNSIVTNLPTTYRHGDVASCSIESLGDLFQHLGEVKAVDGHWKVNIFRLRVKLAILQAEANDQVLALRLQNMTTTDVEIASTIVLARLEEFHNHEIFQLDAERMFQLLYRSDICHVVNLEAAYFATVYRLNAFVAYERETRANPFEIEGLKATSTMKKHKSYAAAHRLLGLLPIAPRGDVGLYWHSHTIMIAAFVTVLAHHINNPDEQGPTPLDAQIYDNFVDDLGTMVNNSGNTELAQMRDFCACLYSRFQQTFPRQFSWRLIDYHDPVLQSKPDGSLNGTSPLT
ncbi:hypothetical protein NX059_006571 [Plenodomus lindquistii]|nr:hypothetical protein NX059_006571 [Plenodomus lindquistii]